MTHIVLSTTTPVLAAGFRAVTQLAQDFSLSDCSAIEKLAEHLQAEHAQLAVIDLAGGITLDAIGLLRATSPAAAIILWVDTVSPEFISQALGLGVRGVLPKHAGVESHLQCLRDVAAGILWVDIELSRTLLSLRRTHLTSREQQLTVMLAQGLKNKEIAFRMGIVEGTVKVYLSRLYSKLGVNDRFELALLTLRNMQNMQSDRSGPLGYGKSTLPAMPAADFALHALVSVAPGVGLVH